MLNKLSKSPDYLHFYTWEKKNNIIKKIHKYKSIFQAWISNISNPYLQIYRGY